MKVAVGCLGELCFLLLPDICVLVRLLIKARKTKTSEDDEEPDEKSPVKSAGRRPGDSDFMIPEAHATGSPGMVASHGSYVVVWRKNSLKTKLFENKDITITIPSFPQTQIQNER